MNKYALAKQKTLAELCVKKDEQIKQLERAVSVLTGSNPNWRVSVSKQDQEIIEGVVGTIWSEGG